MRMDRWMDKRTNEQTELHQFRQEPSYDGDLSPNGQLLYRSARPVPPNDRKSQPV